MSNKPKFPDEVDDIVREAELGDPYFYAGSVIDPNEAGDRRRTKSINGNGNGNGKATNAGKRRTAKI